MEPVTDWSRETVCGYLRGLDTSLQQYPFQEWDVTGHDLLSLSPQRLDALGVRSIGHQELILEAVEQLCALHYELHSENLRSLTEKLCCVSQSLCSHILGLRKTSMHSPSTAISPTPKQLVCIIDIVSAARSLFSWLNRYLFARLNDYSASRDIIALCMELADNLHEDWSNPRIENRILLICQNICGICKSILSFSPDSLLNQTATLELVQIHPETPDYKLGIDIKSTSSGQHFICETEAESPAGRCDKILTGDEIIKVNDQIVVGWTRQNLAQKLVENSDCVTLVLKKVSVQSPLQSPVTTASKKIHTDTTPQQTYTGHTLSYGDTVATSPTKRRSTSLNIKIRSFSSFTTRSTPSTPTDFEVSNLLQTPSAGNTIPVNISTVSRALLGSSSLPETQTSVCDHLQLHSISSQPSSSHPQPICTNLSDSSTEKEQDVTLHSIVETQYLTNSQHSSRPRSGSVTSPTASSSSSSPAPVVLRQSVSDSNLLSGTNPGSLQKELDVGEGHSRSVEPAVEVSHTKSPETVKIGKGVQTKLKSTGSPRYQKGVVTKLSRRRVSCRDLGVPDCDGWLWKRKENAGFMSQKWKRCWCVLKGERLYWYNGPQDEKALGLLTVSSYKLESTWEAKPKKKYEFQLRHATYKPFVFAADSLDDMNKWVTCLIKTLQKHKVTLSAKQEEKCYSETEAEEQDDDQSKIQESPHQSLIPPSPMSLGMKQMAQSPTKNAKTDKPFASQAEDVSTGAWTDVKGADSDGDELKLMISCLQQGGVSLIGTKTTLTRDEYRKSFIRRNKNPDINHKAHTLRVLQSTLKAKLLELDALNLILDNPNLSSSIFRQWKADHEQLYETMWRGPRARGSLGDFINNLNKERGQGAQGRDESGSSD
ncbi:connector enhancer of kinase suppressor of ras 1 [Spea bombifrons]|uniref:connector enhancer of kinase suppressor of ras 1 n=1 Tax=Spea bombifrons TaxID=233779 RepID=UPI00234AFDB0|nr:connector enhancer of kinase suppressor of ras 1 [Spea bombifrons]